MSSVTTMYSPVMAPIAAIFQMNDDLVAKALEGVSAAEVRQPLTDRNNSMIWLAGHITEIRALMLRMLGQQIATTWGELFIRGAIRQDAQRYPSVKAIKSVAEEVNHKLYAKLGSLDDRQVAEPPLAGAPPDAKTVADLIAGFAMHDSYHVGQMGYIRTGLGYSRIAG